MSPTSYQRNWYAAHVGISRATLDALLDTSGNVTQREKDLAAAFLAAMMMFLNCAGISEAPPDDPPV